MILLFALIFLADEESVPLKDFPCKILTVDQDNKKLVIVDRTTPNSPPPYVVTLVKATKIHWKGSDKAVSIAELREESIRSTSAVRAVVRYDAEVDLEENLKFTAAEVILLRE